MNDQNDDAAKETANLSIVQPCNCPCLHRRGFMHIVPCCQGQCEKCGKWFKKGLAEHRQSGCRDGMRPTPVEGGK